LTSFGLAGDGFEPSSQVYETCELPLFQPASFFNVPVERPGE
jgi:hypothetical protein